MDESHTSSSSSSSSSSSYLPPYIRQKNTKTYEMETQRESHLSSSEGVWASPQEARDHLSRRRAFIPPVSFLEAC